MRSIRNLRRGRRGQALLELALALPLLLFISMGIFDFARVVFSYAHASHSLRHALRYGAILGGGDAGFPQYADCQGMIDIAREAMFANEMPVVTVTYIDKDTGNPIINGSDDLMCTDGGANPTPEIIEGLTENGDMILIETVAQVMLVTPFFEDSLLDLTLRGQRTLVKDIPLENPVFCGDNICQPDEDSTICPCDCEDLVTNPNACVSRIAPLVSILSPADGSAGLNNKVIIEVNASDGETVPMFLTVEIFIDGVACNTPVVNEPFESNYFRCTWDTRLFAPVGTPTDVTITATVTDRHGNITTTDPGTVVTVHNLASCGVDADLDGSNYDPGEGETPENCWPDAAIINNFGVTTPYCTVASQGARRYVSLGWDPVAGAAGYRVYAQCVSSPTNLCNPAFSALIHQTTTTSCAGIAGSFQPTCFSPNSYTYWRNNVDKVIEYWVVAVSASGMEGPRAPLPPAPPLAHACKP